MMSWTIQSILLWLLSSHLLSRAINIPCKPGDEIEEDLPDLDTLLSADSPVQKQASTEVVNAHV